MNRYRVITVEDTKESLTKSLHELHDAMLKGSGIGFDLRQIKSKGRQLSVQNEIDANYHKVVQETKRTVNPVYID